MRNHHKISHKWHKSSLTAALRNAFLSVLIITIGMILMPNKAVAQPPPPLLPPCDLDCQGSDWEERSDIVDPGEDGGCKVKYNYKIKKCDDGTIIIKENPPHEVFDCNPNGPFPDGGLPYEVLMAYVTKSYKLISNIVAKEYITEHGGDSCVTTKTTAYGQCLAYCTLKVRYMLREPPYKIYNSTLYCFDVCDGPSEGCCVHIRVTCMRGGTLVITDSVISAPASWCSTGSPIANHCDEQEEYFRSLQNSQDAYRKYLYIDVHEQFGCNSYCDW